MPILHNQINKLWYQPTYDNFKKHGFVKKIFTSNDSEDFLRTGAFLIEEARQYSKTHIPWDESRKYEILANPRLENAFQALGAEYLLKGIFLTKGYAINKPKLWVRLQHPILVRGNKAKLLENEVHDLSYIVAQISRIIDFCEFNKSQNDGENKSRKEQIGQKLDGIVRMTIPFPSAQQILDYLHFKRNYALHMPFIIPEFVGITRHVFNLLDYVAMKGTNRTVKKLSKLTDNHT